MRLVSSKNAIRLISSKNAIRRWQDVFILIIWLSVGSQQALAADKSKSSESSSDQAADCRSVSGLHWLLGEWFADQGETIVYERWQKIDESRFEGVGEWRSADTGEVKSSEDISLIERSGSVFYVVSVAHNEQAVGFKLTQCSETVARFENLEHDFPKVIEYQLQAKGEILADVSDGKEKGFKLHFKLRYDN